MTPDARAYALWSDWCTAAGHHPHEVTERALADFASIVPAADLDRVRSVAERRRPGPRASRDPWTAVEARWASVEASLARCPTHGWIEGVVGRRDAFLIVATRILRLTRASAASLRAGSVPGLFERLAQPPRADAVGTVCGPCVVTRWLQVVATYSRWSRSSVRQQIWSPPTSTGTVGSARPCDGSCADWRTTAAAIPSFEVLVPAIDRHGWWQTWRPMTPRAVTAVLAQRCDPDAPPVSASLVPDHPADGADLHHARFDDTTFGRLDAAIAAADAANERVAAWLAEYEAQTAKMPLTSTDSQIAG